ncbi:MAG: trypsin-like serine protease [Bacteroidetes bacterium]|nr:trypsin-like serine protease [Bacteroidota bacterium]
MLIEKGIPSILKAQLNDTKTIYVPTEIISNSGNAKVHIAQLTNNIEDSKTRGYPGSICCAVDSLIYPNFKGVVTAGHIFTHGKSISYNQYVQPNEQRDVYSNDTIIGKLYYQEINDAIDIAIVELSADSQFSKKCMSFKNSFYECTHKDLYSKEENVTVLSRNNNLRNGFILDFNVTLPMWYDTNYKYVANLILIGSSPYKNNSKTLSVNGDSGSCVYHKKTKQLIGILIGGDENFSFVLPIEEIIKSNNFKIV